MRNCIRVDHTCGSLLSSSLTSVVCKIFFLLLRCLTWAHYPFYFCADSEKSLLSRTAHAAGDQPATLSAAGSDQVPDKQSTMVYKATALDTYQHNFAYRNVIAANRHAELRTDNATPDAEGWYHVINSETGEEGMFHSSWMSKPEETFVDSVVSQQTRVGRAQPSNLAEGTSCFCLYLP